MSTTGGKIFGIGLSKTGTTSLAHALEILGYRTRDYPGITRYRAGDLSSIDLEMVESHDALTDTPIPSFYRELDARFPGSRFILTVRDQDGWLRSCRKQFTERLAAKQSEAHNQLFGDLYGCTVFDEQKFLRGYEKFVAGVIDYFRDRPDDLLVIDVAAGEGWEKLCPFLGRAVPDVPFPKANVTRITWMNIDDVVAVARRAGQMTMRAYRPWRDRSLLGKVMRALRGGDADALRRASLKSHEVIVAGLKALNATIPVLSREGGTVPYAERAKWNHFWLVDPLDGADAFLGAGGTFTVNIALIQDGAPIYGVVYAPATDTVYYARTRAGAFKREGAQEPRRLDARGDIPAPAGPNPADERKTRPAGSRALAMCLVAEGRIDASVCDDPCQEWQSAAAHLIVENAGKRVYDGKTKQPLKYNTERLVNECVTVE